MIASTFQQLYICFRCQATRLDWPKYCRVSGWIRNQRWRPGIGSAYEITCSAAMRDSYKIPTAIPMFLRSSNMTALVRILSYIWVSGILKMASCSRKWIYTVHNLPQTMTWKGIQISSVMMLDAQNISIIGISLPPCLQEEIVIP